MKVQKEHFFWAQAFKMRREETSIFFVQKNKTRGVKTMKQIPNKVFLSEDELPKQYYNIAADMPHKTMPYLHPATAARFACGP
jgi:hypothetical protein